MEILINDSELRKNLVKTPAPHRGKQLGRETERIFPPPGKPGSMRFAHGKWSVALPGDRPNVLLVGDQRYMTNWGGRGQSIALYSLLQ
jgi:hypothetical protein